MAGDTLERLHEDMAHANLAPTWKHVSEFVSVAPRVKYRPFLWKWQNVYDHLMRAGELITPERGAERRSMEHVNPDLKHAYATSHTLATAFQLVRAGETAPAHRHLAAAVRFAVRSRGGNVFTRVQGEPLMMEPFDLLLTPSGTWHEHENNTEHDIVWLDALDFPLVNLLQASWFEPGHGPEVCPAKPAGYTAMRMGHHRPAGWGRYPESTPIMRYPWVDMKQALHRMEAEEGSAYDGIMLEYVNPLTGGPTLPTMSCRMQLLRPGEHLKAHRESTSTIYFVVSGSGHSVIDGQRFDWAEGDVFVVPNWSWHEHANPGDQRSLLFSVTDEPVMALLGMLRGEAYLEHGGHQKVDSVFSPV